MLFIEKDIHEYKFMDELSIAAYYVGFYKFSYNLTKKILDEKKYPPDNYARLHKNLNFSLEKIVN